MKSEVLRIVVRENGEVVLKTWPEETVLSHEQLGIHTKPHSIEDFTADVRREIERTWDRLNGRNW
jgi:hypothetical protein